MIKQLVALAAAGALAVGCVPQGGDRDGDPGVNLPPQADGSIPGNNNNNGAPRVGGEVDYPAGVADTDQVDALDDAQRQGACDALETTFANALPEAETTAFACAVQALFVGLFAEGNAQGTCQMAYDACLADPEGVIEEEPAEPCPLIEQPACTATLAEIEACISDGLAAIVAFNDAFSCALVDEIDPEGMEGMDEGSPACDLVEMKCPGLLSDDDEVVGEANPPPQP